MHATERLQGNSRVDVGRLNEPQVVQFAKGIGRFEWLFDTFDDELMYPGKDTEPNLAANFFFFLVAIDHRTHPPGQIFRGIARGTELAGAELLWAIAKAQFDVEPKFFSPERLAEITAEEVANLFQTAGPEPVRIAGPAERAALLRDCATKLMEKFGGSALNIIRDSGGRLVRDDRRGFLQLLSQFEAYKDPLSKKSFLLVKFLERRRFLVVSDPENLHVPVDNILLRLALRTGMVRLTNKDLDQRIRSGAEVSSGEEEALRMLTMKAFDMAASSLEMHITYLDDILWEFGRIHCKVPTPICNALPDLPDRRPYRIIKSGPIGECPFSVGCNGYMKPEVWKLKEPRFRTAFY